MRELLRGQLQSCVVCSKCHVRSTTCVRSMLLRPLCSVCLLQLSCVSAVIGVPTLADEMG